MCVCVRVCVCMCVCVLYTNISGCFGGAGSGIFIGSTPTFNLKFRPKKQQQHQCTVSQCVKGKEEESLTHWHRLGTRIKPCGRQEKPAERTHGQESEEEGRDEGCLAWRVSTLEYKLRARPYIVVYGPKGDPQRFYHVNLCRAFCAVQQLWLKKWTIGRSSYKVQQHFRRV